MMGEKDAGNELSTIGSDACYVMWQTGHRFPEGDTPCIECRLNPPRLVSKPPKHPFEAQNVPIPGIRGSFCRELSKRFAGLDRIPRQKTFVGVGVRKDDEA